MSGSAGDVGSDGRLPGDSRNRRKIGSSEKQGDQTSWSGQSFDGRHALLPTAILFADEDGESQPALINSIQFRHYKLPDVAVAALGAPAASAIPCNFPLPATLSFQRQEGNLLISWSEALRRGGEPSPLRFA